MTGALSGEAGLKPCILSDQSSSVGCFARIFSSRKRKIIVCNVVLSPTGPVDLWFPGKFSRWFKENDRGSCNDLERLERFILEALYFSQCLVFYPREKWQERRCSFLKVCRALIFHLYLSCAKLKKTETEKERERERMGCSFINKTFAGGNFSNFKLQKDPCYHGRQHKPWAIYSGWSPSRRKRLCILRLFFPGKQFCQHK